MRRNQELTSSRKFAAQVQREREPGAFHGASAAAELYTYNTRRETKRERERERQREAEQQQVVRRRSRVAREVFRARQAIINITPARSGSLQDCQGRRLQSKYKERARAAQERIPRQPKLRPLIASQPLLCSLRSASPLYLSIYLFDLGKQSIELKLEYTLDLQILPLINQLY